MDLKKYAKSQFKGTIKDMVKAAETLRSGDTPKSISFEEILKETKNITLGTFMADIGVDPATDTISNIVSTPDMDVRWIIPEVFRNALLLGYRAAPIWPNIIAAQEQMKGLNQVMPHLNISDAAPRYVGEGETIPLGELSYGSKQFRIYKIGRGIKLTDEVTSYASLNLVSIFMKDFGVKLGHATDVLAIDCLVNGEQTDGSESAPVIGTATGTSLTYKDLLTIWVRMGRIGRTPGTLIGGETVAIDTLDLDEFKTPVMGSPRETLVLKSPIPQKSEFYVHGNIADDQALILDKAGAAIKFNGFPMKVESERIVSNQTEAFYVSLQTGFAKLFRDAAVLVDRSVTIVANPIPTWMDVDALQNVTID